ncbi:MAG: O-antigen ligase family protein [bacterium]|nr:O-antigen ligase family protein [bacterium]
MRFSCFFSRVVQGLAFAALAIILLFPALLAVLSGVHVLWTGRQITAGGDFSWTAWITLLLLSGDAGALNSLSANFLRGCGFLALLCVGVLPGAWPIHLKRLYWGLAAFLIGGLLSVWQGAVLYDGIAAWANTAAAVSAFTAASVLAYRSNDSAVLKRVLLTLTVSALVTALWAWITFAGSSVSQPSMSGNFYNQNLLSGWLLALWPLLCLAVCSANEVWLHSRLSQLGVLLCSIWAVTLFFSYNRTAWAISAFLLLFIAAGANPLDSWQKLCRRGLVCAGIVVICIIGAVWAWQGHLLAAGCCCLILLVLVAGLHKISELEISRCVKYRLLVGILLALVMAGGLGWRFNWGVPRAMDRIQQLAQGGDSSALARWDFFKAAGKISWDYPGLGVGPQGFSRFYPRYQEDSRWYSRYSHCFVLDLLCEYGCPNTLILLGSLGYGFWLALKMWRQERGEGALWRLGIILGVAGMGLHALADVDVHFLTLPLTAAILFGVLLGTPVTRWTFSEEERPSSSFSVRPSLLRQYVLTLAVMFCLAINALGVRSDYYGTLAKYCQERQQLAEALEYCRDAIANNALNSDYHCRLVQIMLNLHLDSSDDSIRFELENSSKAAITADPYRALCYDVRGQALEYIGLYEEALISYQKALALDPGHLPSAYFDAARASVYLGRMESANAYLELSQHKVNASVLLTGLDSPFSHTPAALTVYELFLESIPVQKGWRWEAINALEEQGVDKCFIAYVRGAACLELARAEWQLGHCEQMRTWLAEADRLLSEVKQQRGEYRRIDILRRELAELRSTD